MTTPLSALPGRDDAGCVGTWHVDDWSGKTFELTGKFLGAGSTYRHFHKGHPAGQPAMKGQHCSACRWTEIGLFREDGKDGEYLIVNRGISLVPGETERVSAAYVTVETVKEQMSLLRELGHGGMLFTGPAMQMLAQAAEHDPELAAAAAGRHS
jgi:hypothetical protein